MSAIALRVEGELLSRDGNAAFLLRQGANSHFLRLGLILRGSEEVILPESILDDWGHEIATLELYAWVRENGQHFPRAEIFGFDLTGRPQQCFLRDVDLVSGYACIAYETLAAPLSSGTNVEAVLFPRPGCGPPQLATAPAEIGPPLSGAAVQWWAVDPAVSRHLDLTFLDTLIDNQGG